jgi:hypothetical protein
MFGELMIGINEIPDQVLAESAPYEKRDSITWKQLTEFQLTTIWSLLKGLPYSKEFESKFNILTANEGEVWLYVVPMELRDDLSLIVSDNIPILANRLLLNEEFKFGWSKELVELLLTDLKALASKAKMQNGTLLYWGAAIKLHNKAVKLTATA